MKQTKGNYVFPDILGKMMGKINMRIQFEATMLSLTFILIGMIIMAIYLIGFTPSSLFIKILLGINMGAGFIFLSSHLVTSFQQYQNYLMNVGLMPDRDSIENKFKELKGGNENMSEDEETKTEEKEEEKSTENAE